MSYRDCNVAPEAALACTPLALPRTRPLPAPMAAPAPGLPAAAPMTAPAAAPRTVPTVALATALWVAASSGATPIWDRANCRHPTSSIWKTSKGFPGAGHTSTLGPWGTMAQALSTPIASSSKPTLTYTAVLLLSLIIPAGHQAASRGRQQKCLGACMAILVHTLKHLMGLHSFLHRSTTVP